MQILVSLKNKDVAIGFFGTFEKNFIGFDYDVGFLSGFDLAFFGKQVVTVVLVSSVVFGIIKSGREELIGVFFEGNLMKVLLGKIWSENTNLFDKVELVIGLII